MRIHFRLSGSPLRCGAPGLCTVGRYVKIALVKINKTTKLKYILAPYSVIAN